MCLCTVYSAYKRATVCLWWQCRISNRFAVRVSIVCGSEKRKLGAPVGWIKRPFRDWSSHPPPTPPYFGLISMFIGTTAECDNNNEVFDSGQRTRLTSSAVETDRTTTRETQSAVEKRWSSYDNRKHLCRVSAPNKPLKTHFELNESFQMAVRATNFYRSFLFQVTGR